MSYINLEILAKYIDEQELIRLTDDENLGEINEERLDEAIAAACDEFDNYLEERYDITSFPSPLPPMLIQIVVDQTIYNLYKRRYRLDMPASLISQYQNAIARLKSIANGELSIGLDKKTNAGFIKTNKEEKDRIFSKDTLSKI